tara:strand:+ start:19259 stop:22525 length:3267 start_codon:yes stop_codon:yes gene_type:complete
MAIPNDPVIEETISPVMTNENVIPEEQVISENNTNVKDSDINGNEILNSEPSYEQHASLRTGISKVAKTVTDGVSDFFDSGADSLIAPAVKKQRLKDAKNKKNIEDQSIDENPLVFSADGELRIRNANPDEMAILNNYADGSQPIQTGKKGNKKWKQDEKIILPNLEKITTLDGDKDSLDKFLASTYLAYKDAKIDGKKILEKGNRGFKEIIADANKIGAVDIFLQLMNRRKGDKPFSDSELFAGKKTVLSLQIHAKQLLDKAIRSGNLLDMAKASQAISIEGYASIQLTKVQEDVGRIQVSNKIIAMPSASRTSSMASMLETVDGGTGTAVITEQNLAEFVEAYGGEEGMRQFLAMYNRLPSSMQKNQFAKYSNWKKAGDSLIEIFQSALLSNPLTHGFNFAGQLGFQNLLILERAVGGEGAEALAMMKAQFKYLPQALRAGYHALRHEKSLTEASTKLESNMKAISREAWGLRNTEEGGGAGENAFAHFADGFGVMMRFLGFRPLMAMDDTFKGVSRGMQLEALAVRAKNTAYTAVMDTGKVPKGYTGTLTEYANEQASSAHLKTLHSQTAFDEASEFARMATFQDQLTGMFGDPKYANVLNTPLFKIFIPFYKTPTKIVQRIMERSPLAVLMPSVMKDQLINGSAFQRKQALAKIGVGSGIGLSMLSLSSGLISDDFVMTGYGETDPKARKTWLETHEPYSFGFKQKDGTWDWVNYKRLDPLSGILGFYADTAYSMRSTNDQEFLFDFFLSTALASMKYVATSLPMTQFIGSLIDTAGSSFETENGKRDRIVELFAKQATTTAGTIGQHIGTGGLFGQGMSGTVERYVSPNSSNVMPEERYGYIPYVGMSTFLKGHYEGLNQLRSRIPSLSESLPASTNRWNEPKTQTNGALWETIIPYKVKNKSAGNVINTELNRIGLGFNNLPRNMGEPMLQLSGKQYQRYIELYNNPTSSDFNKILFEEENVPNVLEVFKNVIEGKITDIDGKWVFDEDEENYKKMFNEESELVDSNRKYKITMLRRIDSQYKDIAKKLMFLEYPDLLAVKQQRDSYEDEWGKNPPMIEAPTESEIDTVNQQNKKLLDSMAN